MKRIVISLFLCLFLIGISSATIVFSDNFNDGSYSANWFVHNVSYNPTGASEITKAESNNVQNISGTNTGGDTDAGGGFLSNANYSGSINFNFTRQSFLGTGDRVFGCIFVYQNDTNYYAGCGGRGFNSQANKYGMFAFRNGAQTSSDDLGTDDYSVKEFRIYYDNNANNLTFYAGDSAINSILINLTTYKIGSSSWLRTNSNLISFSYDDFIAQQNSSLDVSLLTPSNGSTINNNTITFNSSITPVQANLTNATLYIYNNAGSLINTSATTLTGSTTSYASWLFQLANIGNYSWNVYACGTNSTSSIICSFASSNYTFRLGSSVNNNFYNATTHETASESFQLNISRFLGSSISSANLFWNGTSYAGTVANPTATISTLTYNGLIIPTSVSTRNVFWSLNYADGTNENLTTFIQKVAITNYSLCGAAPMNIPYLNITFKDETSGAYIQANITSSTWGYWLGGTGTTSKSYTYSNNNGAPTYSFCFDPQNETTNYNVSLRYSAGSNYPYRDYVATGTFTNTTTNLTLNLLSSSDGSYVTFQVVNPALQSISGATVSVYTSGGVLVESKTTDDSGTATFFLNSANTYTVTAAKTGYTTSSQSINPTSTSYTLVLGGGTTTSSVFDYYQGITVDVLPSANYLTNQTSYNFNFTLNSTYWTVTNFNFTLINASGYVLGSAAASTNGGIISATANTGLNDVILMNYQWTINNTVVNGTRTWFVYDGTNTGNSIANFVTDLKTFLGSSNGLFGLKKGFGLNLIIFIIAFTITGVVSYKFGLTSPAAILLILTGSVAIFDTFALDLITYSGLLENGKNIATMILAVTSIVLIIREGYS